MAPSTRSRRELITSSAAVRIAPHGARAKDVTDLLRQTLIQKDNRNGSQHLSTDPDDQDSLVLVGTVFSLPKEYVQFEHERPYPYSLYPIQTSPYSSSTQQHSSQFSYTSTTSINGNGTTATAPGRSSSSDPFHVVRTLQPDEDPLLVKEALLEYLEWLQESSPIKTLRTIIRPQVQWFYVPGSLRLHENTSTTTTTSSMISRTLESIPNCIELDGYCTSMEDDDTESENDDDDDESDQGDSEEEDDGPLQNTDAISKSSSQARLLRQFPWLLQDEQDTDDNNDGDKEEEPTQTVRLPADIDCRRQERRFYRLLQDTSSGATYSSLGPGGMKTNCLSGYLLKRSKSDRHVWKRVYCILTNDHLWFVSRMYNKSYETSIDGGTTSHAKTPSSSSEQRSPRHHHVQYAKHGRIRLTRALLLEPAANYAPLYRTPFSFEVVSANGTSHVFRTSNKRLQLLWIRSISDRIVQSFENSLLEQPEMIVADECSAKSRRVIAGTVEPLWEACVNATTALTTSPTNDEDVITDTSSAVATPLPFPTTGNPVGAVLRWGLQVADFRENCRCTHYLLPAKSPVVASSSSNRSQPRRSPTNIDDTLSMTPEPIDPIVQDMIRSCWDQATALLARGTHIASYFQPHRLPSSLETLCRHIEFVITGHFRPVNGSNGTDETVTSSTRPFSNRSPPPIDLLDHLLAELQLHAANYMTETQSKTKDKQIDSNGKHSTDDESNETTSNC